VPTLSDVVAMRDLRPRLRPRLFCAALLAGTGALSAQTPSTSVPVDLANVLLAPSSGVYDPQYFVGAAPPGWPVTLAPESPARVLGGLRHPRQLTMVFVDSTVRQPLAAYVRKIETAGLTRPASPPQHGFASSGGFQSTDGRLPFWCTDSARVRVTARPDMAGLTQVRVAYEMLPAGTCAPSERTAARMQGSPTLTQLKLPPLLPPAGMLSRGAGGGGGGSSIHASVRFDTTTISPAELLAHYSVQLVKAGWTAYPPTVNGSFVGQPFEALDEQRRTWRGTLLVMPTGIACEVTILMARPDDR
jgi:hypothetical protein